MPFWTMIGAIVASGNFALGVYGILQPDLLHPIIVAINFGLALFLSLTTIITADRHP